MYNIFISHSWSYSNQYEKLIDLLNSVPYFTYRDYSVPKDDPIHDAPNTELLTEAIKEQMSHASCVLVLAGVYSSYSKWINIEVDLAKNAFITPKKIIAIDPWGAERTSQVVKRYADEIVKWNSNSIVNAIRGHNN